MRKGFWAMLIVVALAMALTGALAEGEKVFPDDYRIGVCVMGRPDEWSIQCYDAFVEATKGFKEAIILDGNLDHETQSKQVEDLITQQVDLIIIDPYNPDGFDNLFEKAKNAGIPVGCYDSKANWDGISFYVTWSHEETGILAGEWATNYINSVLGGKATIGILDQADYPFAAIRAVRFREAMAKLPGVVIKNDQSTAHTREAGQNTVLNYPEPVDIIFGVNDNCAQGALAALRQLGNTSTIVISAGGYGEECFSLLKADDPNYKACVMVDPVILAKETIEEAEKLLTGKGGNVVGRYMEIYVADAGNINDYVK